MPGPELPGRSPSDGSGARRRSPATARYPELRRSRLALAAFDVLPSEAAVLDTSGVILMVNEAWRRFGRENGAGAVCGPGVDYLRTCQRSAASGDHVAAAVAAALTAVLSGHAPEAALDYPCHSPRDQRWFHLSIRPLHGQRRLLVLHDPLPAQRVVVLPDVVLVPRPFADR